jgi:hypothetical protein
LKPRGPKYNQILEKSYKFTQKILRIILPLCQIGEGTKSRRGIALPRRDRGPLRPKGGKGVWNKKDLNNYIYKV